MKPTIKPGDRVLAWKGYYLFKKPEYGDLIVFKLKDKHLIKRIKQVKNNSYYVSGDNPSDSMDFNIRPNEIIGKVVFKY